MMSEGVTSADVVQVAAIGAVDDKDCAEQLAVLPLIEKATVPVGVTGVRVTPPSAALNVIDVPTEVVEVAGAKGVTVSVGAA